MLIPHDNWPQTVDAIGTLTGVRNEGEVMAHFPAGDGQHSGQLATSCDGDAHQSTASGTFAVCCALQRCTASDSAGSEVARIWAAIRPAL